MVFLFYQTTTIFQQDWSIFPSLGSFTQTRLAAFRVMFYCSKQTHALICRKLCTLKLCTPWLNLPHPRILHNKQIILAICKRNKTSLNLFFFSLKSAGYLSFMLSSSALRRRAELRSGARSVFWVGHPRLCTCSQKIIPKMLSPAFSCQRAQACRKETKNKVKYFLSE